MAKQDDNKQEIAKTGKKMPKSVLITVIALGIYIAFAAVMQAFMLMNGKGGNSFFALGLFLMLLIMFATGMRLGRPILIFFIAISLLGVLAAIIMPAVRSGQFSLRTLFIMLAIACPLIIALAGILQKSAKAYSGYICPSCGSGSLKALDFMYNKAQCKDCGNTW